MRNPDGSGSLLPTYSHIPIKWARRSSLFWKPECPVQKGLIYCKKRQNGKQVKITLQYLIIQFFLRYGRYRYLYRWGRAKSPPLHCFSLSSLLHCKNVSSQSKTSVGSAFICTSWNQGIENADPDPATVKFTNWRKLDLFKFT